jgi:hypothetical protein
VPERHSRASGTGINPRLNAVLKQIVCYVRNDKGQLVSDGRLAVYKKENLGQGAEWEREEAADRNPQGAEGRPTSILYAILDRTGQLGMKTHWY